MRVLHVQRVSGIAGSERYLLRLLPELVRRGVDARFLTLEPTGSQQLNQPFYEALDRCGILHDRLHVGDLPTPASLVKLARAVRRQRPDLVHSHLVHADLFTACLKRFLLPALRFVSTKHGYREVFQAEHGLDGTKIRTNPYSLVARFVTSSHDASFAVSRGLQRMYVDGKLSAPDRITVIPHGMEPTPPEPVDPALRVGDPQIVVVGRLVEFKGHRYALDAVARVAARYPSMRMVFVGTGPLKAKLEARARALGLGERVVFTGFSDRALAHMRAADVMLVPSTSEGFGLVFLEAFDVGVPVVAFDVPAANEIIQHDRSGLLVPFEDVSRLAAAIERLLESPDERARLAAGGAARLRDEFSLEKMVSRTIDFYDQVLAGGERR